MKKFPVFTSNQQTQIPLVLTLIIAALLLLGTWGSLATVKATDRSEGASGLPESRVGYRVMSGTMTVSLYFPYIRQDPTPTPTHTPTPTYIFFDDFSNPNSGWIVGSGGNCAYEYRDGYYRITITDDKGHRCVAFNTLIPKTINGTFSVRVRRTSSSGRELHYGFYFGAGVNAEEDRWFLEVGPHKVPECDDRGFFWLSAIEDGSVKFFADRCTGDVNTDTSEWNDLKVVRDGPDIAIYMNGKLKETYDKDVLLDKGYFDLVVVGVTDISDSKQGIVEFDDFLIEP